MKSCVVWLCPKRLLPLGHRIADSALPKQKVAKVEIRIAIIRSHAYCLVIMADRFIDEASLVENSRKTILDECATKVVIRGSGASANLQCSLEVGARAVQFASLQEQITEIVMRHVVLTRNSQPVVPQHLPIFPI